MRRPDAMEIGAVVLAAPALLFPSPARLVLAIAVPAVWVWYRYRDGRLLPPTPMNAPLIALLAMVAVSLLVTFDVTASLGKVCGVVLGVLVFWAIARWTSDEDRLMTATASYLIAGGALAVVGLFGTNWFEKFALLGTVASHLPKAIRGVPGAESGFQPNAVAGCLVLFIPLQIALIAGRVTVARLGTRAQLGLLGLTMLTLLLTQSRGAWAGLMAAGLAFLLWHSRRTRVSAVILLAIATASVAAIGPRRMLNLAISQSGPGMESNISSRVDLWARALQAIGDFPITGMGMNVFRRAVPPLYSRGLPSPDLDVAHAHNHLLQAAVDLGIPGLVAYLWIWVIAALLLVRTYRNSSSRPLRTIAAGLGAGLLAHFCFGMTDAIALGAKPGVLFWFTLALVVALYRVAGPAPEQPLTA